MATSDAFARQERQVQASQEALGAVLAELDAARRRNDVGAAKRLMSEATRSIALTRQAVRRMENSLRGLQQSQVEAGRSALLAQEDAVASAERKLKEAKADLERKDLFGASGASGGSFEDSFGRAGAQTGSSAQGSSAQGSSGGGEDEGQGQDRLLLQETMQSLERSSGLLANSQHVMSETEEISANVLSNLGEQGESLLQATDRVRDTNSTAQRARGALRRMSRRACYNRALLWSVIVLLCALIVIILYIKLIK